MIAEGEPGTHRRLPPALRVRDFRLLWLATVMSNVVVPMQFITLTFWAVDTYPDQKVLYSGLIVATRGLGMLVFSLFGGALADRFERRHVLRCTEISTCALTGLMAVATLADPLGEGTIVLVLGLTFLAAATMAVDTPARSASIPVIVGPALTGRAIGLYNVALQLTFPIVLPLVGYLNGSIGPGKVLAVSLLAWVVILPLMFMLQYSSRVDASREAHRGGLFGDIREGLKYARRDAVITAVMAMVLVLQVIAMPGVGMLGPVWMTEVLDLSRAQFGFIAMLWGLGAFTSSLVFASLTRYTRRGSFLAALVIGFAAAAIIFGYSRSVPLTAAANFALGFAFTGMLVTSMTIVQYTVPEALRGRVMGLFPLAMGASMLNVGVVGALSEAVGLEVIVPLMGWVALASALAITAASPALRRVGREPDDRDGDLPTARDVVTVDSTEARVA